MKRFYNIHKSAKVVSIIIDKEAMKTDSTIQVINGGLEIGSFPRYLCKKRGQEMVICRLNDSNTNQYHDLQTSAVDGSEGDIMNLIPEIWYKYRKIDANKFQYDICFTQPPGFKYEGGSPWVIEGEEGAWIHLPSSLYGTYKGSLVDDKIYSISGVTPVSAKTLRLMKTYCRNRGEGYDAIKYIQHMAVALLFYARYGTLNSDNVLGNGGATFSSSAGVTPTGTSTSTGIQDTVKTTTNYVVGMGIEGVYGGCYEAIGDGEANNHVLVVPDGNGGTHELQMPTSNGWVTSIHAEDGPFFDLMAKAIGGSSKTYYCDYYTQGTGIRGVSISYQDSANYGGISTNSIGYALDFSNITVGIRLGFTGKIVEEYDVNTFKNIPI